MASRVNTFAQLVMAPCTAPSVEEIISGGVGARYSMNNSSINGKRQAANKIPFEPSSDEDDSEAKTTLPYLRGNQSCLKIPPLVFQPMRFSDVSGINGEYPSKHNRP